MFKKLFGKKTANATAIEDPIEAAKQAYQDLKNDRGASDPETLQALFTYGQALNSIRRFEEAQAAGEELLHTFEAEFGPDHPNVGYGLDIIASALFGQNKHSEALEYRQRGVALLEGHFGAEHEMTLQRARLLAIDYAETEQLAEAKKVLAKYMPASEAIPPLQADFMDTLAFVTQAEDGPEAAIPVLEDLIGFFREHGQDNTSKYASKLFNLSQLYLRANREDDALNASSEAGIVALETYGPDHPAAQEIFAFQTDLRTRKEAGEF